MNGVHDLGGMHGFGPVIRESNEPAFHSAWEKRVFAMALTLMGGRVWNVDEFRRTIERMPPARYLAATYYDRWIHAVESLLVEKGAVTPEELLSGHATTPAPARDAGPPASAGTGGVVNSFDSSAVKLRFDKSFKPRFKPGDRVVARNLNPENHTRLPRYARGKRGIIRYDQGVFVFPDTHAHGQGAKPQHVYTVAFEAKELWGADRRERAAVYLDCWENYLERERGATMPAGEPALKSAGKVRMAKPPAKARSAASRTKKGRKR